MALDRNNLVQLAKTVAKADPSASVSYSFNNENFTYAQLNETLRREFNELAGTYSYTDTVTIEEVKEEVNVSDYLNEQALEGGEERQYGSYIIEDVVTGTFCVVAKENAEFHIQDSVAAYADYEYGTMLFDKYAVIEGAYVEAGEPVVKVHINVSEADITAARLAIQRMEERVEADRVIYEKEDAILKRKAYGSQDSQVNGVAIWEYETSLEHHRQDIESQQKAIEKAKDRLLHQSGFRERRGYKVRSLSRSIRDLFLFRTKRRTETNVCARRDDYIVSAS